MTYRFFQVVSVLLPTVLIGGFEYIRHDYLLPYMSMETGNFYITILTFVLSFLFAIWMFRTIRSMNDKLVEAQAKRAVYEERDRLARELHDGIAQSLFFLNVKLKQGKVDDALAAVSSIDHDVRQAIFNLRALPEEGSSLSVRLEKWVTQWSVHTGIEVTQTYDLADDILSPAEQVQLFGLIQEAFANIRKHANAKHASIRVSSTLSGRWELIITDDGCGITDQPSGRPKYGLTMMKERAAHLKATISITGREEGGTRIQVSR
ncbi:sensor histidine kinase [Brevibacillus sp. SYSU BS000544]|uniref:sensor histidine kinase n=1 Tax=Brevibacillus sp. SYSU BS000544 TaxID=3416443 RepID=UPI003CE529C0